MAAPTIPEAIKALEEEIGLPPGFFERIAAEDDWSFVIKLHALIEHCVASLTANRTKSIGLDRVTQRLRFNDTKTGKLAVARDLELLSGEYVEYIQAICKIRNHFVHDVKAISIPLKIYLDECNNKAELSKKVCRLMNPEADIKGTRVRAVDLFNHHPKIALQITAMDLLADIHIGYERVQLENKREQLAQETLALFQARRELDAIMGHARMQERSGQE